MDLVANWAINPGPTIYGAYNDKMTQINYLTLIYTFPLQIFKHFFLSRILKQLHKIGPPAGSVKPYHLHLPRPQHASIALGKLNVHCCPGNHPSNMYNSAILE